MKSAFSRTWNRSKQTRKQRKFRYNAPLNILGKFMGAPLSKELRKKYGKRTMRVRKGDTIKIMRGQFKGKVGKVSSVDIKRTKIYLDEVMVTKKDGSKTNYPIHPSNVVITSLNLDDRRRISSQDAKADATKVSSKKPENTKEVKAKKADMTAKETQTKSALTTKDEKAEEENVSKKDKSKGNDDKADSEKRSEKKDEKTTKKEDEQK